MRHTRTAAHLSLVKLPCMAAILLWLTCSHAATVTAHADIQALPSLPGSDLPPPLRWHLNEQGAALAYRTQFEKWEAKIDSSANAGATVALDYGVLLTNRLGAGTTFTREGDYSEIVANAVYAYKHNVRFRLAAAQLRTTGSSLVAYGDALDFRQNSFLFSARKYWPAERFVSDLGLALYTVDATPSTPSLLSALSKAQALDPDADRPTSVTSGKLDGLMLNLGLRPAWDSKIELRREFSQIAYRPYSGSMRSEFLASGRIAYQQQLGNCMHLRGSYSAWADTGRLDFSLATDDWSLMLSQDTSGAGQETALYISLSIPLDGNARASTACAAKRERAPYFAPIVDATLQRPQQFPREPIAVVDAE